jgi:hypothetical protein
MAHDVRASVEIALSGVGWVRAPEPTPDESQIPKPKVQQKEQKEVNEVQPPPPTTAPPPQSLPENPDQAHQERKPVDGTNGNHGSTILVKLAVVALVPLLVLVLPCLAVVGLKGRRRRRRRRNGPPAKRVAGAWTEVIDLARDLGTPVPPKATRREIGRFIPAIHDQGFDRYVDGAVFGGETLADADAVATWLRADAVRATMLADRKTGERVRSAVSLTSLR